MLSQTAIGNVGYFAGVDHIGGKGGRKGTLKPTTVSVVPEDLVEDALVVGREETIVPIEG